MMSRGIWLHATEPALVPALRVLEDHLTERRDCPPVHVTGEPGDLLPEDDLRGLDAAFDTVAPALLVLAGDRLPVPMIDRARARGVGVMLVDCADPQLSGGFRLLRRNPRATLSKLAEIHTRDAISANQLERNLKGAVPILPSGALARHGAVPGCNMLELGALRDSIGARPVWFAQDVPASEIDAVFLAHSHALRRAHRLLMILEPRDMAEGEAIARRAGEVGFLSAQRASEDEIAETTQVYVADLGDDPGLFLRLAPVSYLGGSLTRGAGTGSPILPAALGSALVFGPHGDAAARALMDRLRFMGAGRQIEGASDLGPAISTLLSPEAGAEAALKAWTLATEGEEATQVVAKAVIAWINLHAPQGEGGPA